MAEVRSNMPAATSLEIIAEGGGGDPAAAATTLLANKARQVCLELMFTLGSKADGYTNIQELARDFAYVLTYIF